MVSKYSQKSPRSSSPSLFIITFRLWLLVFTFIWMGEYYFWVTEMQIQNHSDKYPESEQSPYWETDSCSADKEIPRHLWNPSLPLPSMRAIYKLVFIFRTSWTKFIDGSMQIFIRAAWLKINFDTIYWTLALSGLRKRWTCEWERGSDTRLKEVLHLSQIILQWSYQRHAITNWGMKNGHKF